MPGPCAAPDGQAGAAHHLRGCRRRHGRAPDDGARPARPPPQRALGPPELQLYPAISEALSQWAKSTSSLGPSPELVRIVGPRWSPRSHEFRDLLARNSISHGFYDADSQDGRRLLAQAGVEAAGSPVLLLFDGRVLVDPPTGETPSGYLRRIRIEAAKQLLETTADPVDHLRARVGYGDPTAFRRAFTRATGLGPRQYRQKYGPRPRDT